MGVLPVPPQYSKWDLDEFNTWWSASINITNVDRRTLTATTYSVVYLTVENMTKLDEEKMKKREWRAYIT